MDDFYSRQREALSEMSKFLTNIGKEVSRYMSELKTAPSVDECMARWARIKPIGDKHADDLIQFIINEAEKNYYERWTGNFRKNRTSYVRHSKTVAKKYIPSRS